MQREALRQAEHLFASLLDRAFSGEESRRVNSVKSDGSAVAAEKVVGRFSGTPSTSPFRFVPHETSCAASLCSPSRFHVGASRGPVKVPQGRGRSLVLPNHTVRRTGQLVDVGLVGNVKQDRKDSEYLTEFDCKRATYRQLGWTYLLRQTRKSQVAMPYT